MSGRPFLRTMGALFILAGAGQVIGAFGVTHVDASLLMPWDGETGEAPVKEVTDTGIVVRDEVGPILQAEDDEAQLLVAQRIELRQAAAEMKAERERMEAAQKALSVTRADERQRLASLYSRMPAEKTAAILSSLAPAEAAEFISAMNDDAAAAVLSQMSDDQAIAVSRELVSRGL